MEDNNTINNNQSDQDVPEASVSADKVSADDTANDQENSSSSKDSGSRSDSFGGNPRSARGGRNRDRGERGGKGGDKRGGRRRRDEKEESGDEFQEVLIPGGVFKCSKVVKGGRRFSFGALVCVGDGKGRVGQGYGKAKEVPMAIQKAINDARRNIISFPLEGDGTIPHEIHGKYGAAHVVLVPAGPGTGIIAGATVKTVLELGGVHNVLTKSFGSNNRKNLVKATFNALENLRNNKAVEALRGVTI